MVIHGLSKLTLLDYPGHLACTVFTGACNMRCPFCHNASLVLAPHKCPTIPEEEFFDFLKSRKGKLEGVCITGGEPTLQKDLATFIEKIRSLGFLVKLDSNGYRPDILWELIKSDLINMIAMDVKNSPKKYARTIGLPPEAFNVDEIDRSISILKSTGINHEFRTTVVRELHDPEDIVKIAQWIEGDSPYFLQAYKDSGDVIFRFDDSNEPFTAYTDIEMRKLLGAARRYAPNARIRGDENS
ncbi:MAG: anaerobic ribonucleoside-triphosphate reductase activating protein [Lachnospiraceae bacterium]|nr:anaerobic ribonucleoside-triphosphate reductase activating protein [Lachnospiraceae bacterium]